MGLTRRETTEILLGAYMPAVLMSFAKWRLPLAITSFYVSHPWEMIFATFTLPMLGMMYLHPKSPLRLALVPFVTLGVYCYRSNRLLFMPNRTIASVLEGPFYLLFLTTIDALLLRKIYLGKDGKEKSEIQQRREKSTGKNVVRDQEQDYRGITSWTAVGWANRVIFSYRAIGLPKQAPNVPKWSNKDPNYVPSRTVFLLKRGLAILIAYLFVDIISHQPPADGETFSVAKAPLFPSIVNAETIGTRIVSTILFWTILRFSIGLVYNLVSFCGVATFLTTPADWPPYFGSPFDAFTIRKFWAVFWHTGLRNPLVSTANFIIYDALQIPRGSLVGRYANIYLTFAISGTIHKLVDDTAGIPLPENTAYIVFLMQAVGIAIEDFVEWVYHKYASTDKEHRGVKGKSGVNNPHLWQKIVGYLWVGAWLAWTTPTWSYANIRHDGAPLFPFSAVETFRALQASA